MGKDYDLGDGGFTMPATESIDEALARLARQDARRTDDGGIGIETTEAAPTAFQVLRGRTAPVDRLQPPPPPTSAAPPGWGTTPARSSQPTWSGLPATTSRPAKDAGLKIVRWLIVLGFTWFIWRYFIRGL